LRCVEPPGSPSSNASAGVAAEPGCGFPLAGDFGLEDLLVAERGFDMCSRKCPPDLAESQLSREWIRVDAGRRQQVFDRYWILTRIISDVEEVLTFQERT